jgi:hypothetical protein
MRGGKIRANESALGWHERHPLRQFGNAAEAKRSLHSSRGTSARFSGPSAAARRPGWSTRAQRSRIRTTCACTLLGHTKPAAVGAALLGCMCVAPFG